MLLSLIGICLLFDDLQDLHGAGLDTDAAGDALGSSVLHDHDLHGADLDTLATGDALLLVDHVHTGLGVLSDSLMLTDLHALAALNADVGLCSIALGNDADAAQIFVKLLIESGGTGFDALQASHALCALFNSELLHKRTLLYRYIYIDIIHGPHKKSNGKKQYYQKIVVSLGLLSLFFRFCYRIKPAIREILALNQKNLEV